MTAKAVQALVYSEKNVRSKVGGPGDTSDNALIVPECLSQLCPLIVGFKQMKVHFKNQMLDSRWICSGKNLPKLFELTTAIFFIDIPLDRFLRCFGNRLRIN